MEAILPCILKNFVQDGLLGWVDARQPFSSTSRLLWKIVKQAAVDRFGEKKFAQAQNFQAFQFSS
jgi:hypothetical protein